MLNPALTSATKDWDTYLNTSSWDESGAKMRSKENVSTSVNWDEAITETCLSDRNCSVSTTVKMGFLPRSILEDAGVHCDWDVERGGRKRMKTRTLRSLALLFSSSTLRG